MPVDITMSFSLPLCCAMGTCSYDAFHWQRRMKSKHKGTLPKGVYDDKYWTTPTAIESGTQINVELYEKAHENLGQGQLSIWTSTDETHHGNLSYQNSDYPSDVKGNLYYCVIEKLTLNFRFNTK